MSFECIRYRFRLNADQSSLELLQLAALESLRHSPRCRSWRVLPAPRDPSVLMLAIEWEPGVMPAPFRGSAEFVELHAALGEHLRALEEADYLVDPHSLRRILGGTETLIGLAEDIVAAVAEEPELGQRFESRDGSKRARLGLWLLEVLGGPDMFSASFPDALKNLGPLSDERLDLDDRDRFLEIALAALPNPVDERARCVLGTLRAHLPLHPSPPSQRGARPLEHEAEDEITTVAPLALMVSERSVSERSVSERSVSEQRVPEQRVPERRAGVADEAESHQLARYSEVRLRPKDDGAASGRLPLARSPDETEPASYEPPAEREDHEVESGKVPRAAPKTDFLSSVGRWPPRPTPREGRPAVVARRSKRRG